MQSYKTVEHEAQDEFVEQRSRFIGYVKPVTTEEEALDFINEKRRKHWDATHNVYAYSLRSGQLRRCSDDGEPHGTAGMPALDVILKSDVTDVVVVVTRYFGGTLLGTGGLVRAYSAAVRAGLEASTIIEKQLCRRMTLRMDYSMLGKIQYLTADLGLPVISTEYTDLAQMELLVPMQKQEQFLRQITEVSGGRIVPEEGEICYGAQAEGQTLIFSV